MLVSSVVPTPGTVVMCNFRRHCTSQVTFTHAVIAIAVKTSAFHLPWRTLPTSRHDVPLEPHGRPGGLTSALILKQVDKHRHCS